MKRPVFFSFLAYVARFLGVLIVLLPVPVAAQDWTEKDTVIAFTPLAPQPLGRSIGVSLRLTDEAGELIPYRRLEFFLGGKWTESTYTNSQGVAKIRLNNKLPAGRYTLKAAFAGYKNLRASSATTALTVAPAALTVSTVPPLEGVDFSLAGRVFTTGADGTAQISVTQPGLYRLEAGSLSTSTSRATFARWKNGIFEASRNVEVPNVRFVEAGFNVEYKVEATFVDLEGQPVSADRISEVNLRSSYGAMNTFGSAQHVWLQARRIVRRPAGLVAKKIGYVLESVMIDGSNVVNRGQQRFLVDRKSAWEIELLLYYARFQAVDAVFRFPLGTGVALEYPDGDTELLHFGATDEIRVGPLARGLYNVQVVGAHGMAPLTPVALSRDQAVELKVLSRLDVTVGLALGATFALSLLLIGRPQLIGLKRRQNSSQAFSSSSASSPASLHLEHHPTDWR